MQALLNDIELDIQELRCLIEAISRQSDSALRSVAKRNILQMRSRLEALLQQLEELPSSIDKPKTIDELVQEPWLPSLTEIAEEIQSLEVEATETEPQPMSTVILADRIKPVGELRRSISLNDSFRFSRELFGNDTAMMNQVLQQVGEMISLDAAMAFLSSKVKVDEESEAMADFVELLKKYFNNQ